MSERFPQKIGKSQDLENPKRRGFLKGLLGIGALAAVGGQPLKELFEETITPEQLEKELQECTEKLRSEYGIDIDFSAIPDTRGSSYPLSLAERCDFAKSISEAVELYPKSYISGSGLKTVQGVKWLALKNQKDPMATTEGYFVKNDPGRLVVNKEDIVNYFFKDKFGWGNSERTKATFHHEFYHKMDPHLHDKGYNNEWDKESLGKGAEPRRVHFLDNFAIRREGFTSAYGAVHGSSEDRAEIAAALFTDPVKLEQLATGEPALLDKVEKIKKEYFDNSKGLFDETYWKLRGENKPQAIRDYLTLQETMQPKV